MKEGKDRKLLIIIYSYMAVSVPTNLQELTDSFKNTVEWIGKSERTMFIGITFVFLIAIIFMFIWATNNIKEQRDAFITQMEKRDEVSDRRELRVQQSMEKLSDALDRNTQVLYEIKSSFNK